MATLILNQAATHLTVTVAILLQATLQAVVEAAAITVTVGGWGHC
jgi:hypothetical protein